MLFFKSGSFFFSHFPSSSSGKGAGWVSIEKEKILENQQQSIEELHQTCYSKIRQEMEEDVFKDVIERVVESQASQIMATTMLRLKEKEMEVLHEMEAVS